MRFPDIELEIDFSGELDKKNCAKDTAFGCEEIAKATDNETNFCGGYIQSMNNAKKISDK